MRKVFLAILIVVGLCVSGDAQSAQMFPASIQKISSKLLQSPNPNVTRLSGNVEIVFAGGTALADNAVVHRDTNEIELSGNVRLKLDPPAAK